MQRRRPAHRRALRLWNYAKTAARGVRHFAVYIDGALLYQGSLRPAPPRPTGLRADGSSDASFVQTVLFTDNQALIEQERANVYTKEELEEETVLVDNGTRIGGSLTEEGNCRPTTAAVGSGGRPPAGGGQPRSSMTLACGASLVLVFNLSANLILN